MADFLIQATLSNFVVASILAGIAWVIQRRVRSASLSNLLWALVLIKVLTPPLLSIPVLGIPSFGNASVMQSQLPSGLTPPIGRWMVDERPDSEMALGEAVRSFFATHGIRNVTIALPVWMVVSGLLFLFSGFRIIRFHRLLQANSNVHDGLSNGLSVDVANQFSLRKHPEILITQANIAPFVWWRAGRAVIVVSGQAKDDLSDEDLRMVVAHEMAHIKRRDHWFRWIEWFALIGLWWNPVMWWARRQLRISEEMACDDLVLEIATPEVHQYGNALLNMAELLTTAAIRPPVVESAMNSGGSLEERLKMMIADRTRKVSLSMRMSIVALATCVFPLGVVYAQDFEAIETRLGSAVVAGELSEAQANLMLDALRRSTSSREMEEKKQRYEQFINEIKEAVEAGQLSEEESEMKLAAIRRAMFEAGIHGESKLTAMEAKKRRYKLFMDEIKATAEAGKLSEEEAEMKLAAVRREMFDAGIRGESKLSEMEAKKQRDKLFTEEIRAAVEAGKLSEEEAEEKLIDVRREMFEETP